MRRAIALGFLLHLAACAAVPGDQSGVSSIAAVRAGASASRVAVEGVVTVTPGTFDAGFALQDASGGIYVTDGGGVALASGDRARVEGRFTLASGQASLADAKVNRLGEGAAVVAHEIATGVAGPSSEGRLIVARGTMTGAVVDDQPWGWKFYLDDGSGALLIFVAAATGIDLKHLRAGDQLRITGFSGRYAEHTEFLPRTAADIAAAGPR